MKVGFAIEVNQGLDSPVYGHFGSAPAFLIVDTELDRVSVVDNSNAHRVHGACSPLATLGDGGLDAMIVGGIGPGAIMKLNAMGVKVFRAGAATVRENLSLLGKGVLRELSMDDVCREHGGNCGH